mgnify:FL=1
MTLDKETSEVKLEVAILGILVSLCHCINKARFDVCCESETLDETIYIYIYRIVRSKATLSKAIELQRF